MCVYRQYIYAYLWYIHITLCFARCAKCVCVYIYTDYCNTRAPTQAFAECPSAQMLLEPHVPNILKVLWLLIFCVDSVLTFGESSGTDALDAARAQHSQCVFAGAAALQDKGQRLFQKKKSVYIYFRMCVYVYTCTFAHVCVCVCVWIHVLWQVL